MRWSAALCVLIRIGTGEEAGICSKGGKHAEPDSDSFDPNRAPITSEDGA
jgi:hypothetical protein